MAQQSSSGSSKRIIAILVLIAIGGAGFYFAWRWLAGPRATSAESMMAAIRANSRGLGELEHFKAGYPKAIKQFEEATRLAPDWLAARINLGIALMNDENSRPRCVEVFEGILKQHPDNPYAHFCLGILAQSLGDIDVARGHFEAVTRIDPNDAASWYWLGQALSGDSERANECFQRALDLDPYLSSAIYNVAMNSRTSDINKTKALLAEHQTLDIWSNVMKVRYTEMGRYACAINPLAEFANAPENGPIPSFSSDSKMVVQLAPGARWARAEDFGKGPTADLQKVVRERFGAVIVGLDYNKDGKLDLFLLGAVVEGGKVRDLLLRNDGNNHFTDVTADAGLAGSRPSLGCSVADFDNDGHPDLFITGAGEQHLFRNTGKGKFEDVTAEAGLDKVKTVCLGAAFLDLDQDGDLDLVLAQYAPTPEQALAGLQSKVEPKGAGFAVYLNVGEAPPTERSRNPPPLTPKFRRMEMPAGLLDGTSLATSIAVSDVDGDGDLDLLLFADAAPPAILLNDRLLRFHRANLLPQPPPKAKWNGAMVLDADHDGRFDLFLVQDKEKPLLLLNRCPGFGKKTVLHWEQGSVDSPPLMQAQAIDLDLDGWTDVVGLSNTHKPVFLHHEGKGLAVKSDALGGEADWASDLIGFFVADLNGDGYPDLLGWSESKGLQLRINQKNANRGLLLNLVGHRHTGSGGEPMRCNADAVGTVVIAQVKNRHAKVENSTLSAGLGQSRQPLVLGIGADAEPDVVLLRWPDLVWQAEFNVPTGVVHTIDEENRKDTSCPVLFAWNGERFGLVTDFLGAGSMGEMLSGGGHRPPRPEESVKIESEQLVPLDGRYVLKVCEPMIEVIYLDRLQLTAIDHPADVRVYPDERFVSTDPPPTQDLLAFREQIFPVKAKDHRGRDVTDVLSVWDRRTVADFKKRTWLGFAEEHWVELDFGDRLARFGPKDPLFLCLAGWTDYAYPESIFAASQAGVEMQPPVLERLEGDGKWHTVVADPGFPAGLPRMITVDVSGKLCGPNCVLRLRTNLHVYWDQVFASPLPDRVKAESLANRHKETTRNLRITCLNPVDATLEARGCPKEFSPDGKLPTLYDYDRRDSFPVARMSGRLTRLGPVTELLTELDDRFVIFGPGEEVSVSFNALALPELPKGWKRSFVLRTWGYCKDASPFTETSETIEPLPFRGMKNYPYGPEEQYPRDAKHDEYQRQYNTREIGSGVPRPPRR